MNHGIFWAVFVVMVLVMLVVDFRLFSKGGKEVGIKKAAFWSILWIIAALAFNAGIFFFGTRDQALNFLTGYLIERALSLDNLFVFLLIFNYFKVKNDERQEVLFWGILLALVMRVIFIAAGMAIINAFHWTIYVLGAFLVFVGGKMLFSGDKEIDLEKNKVLQLIRRFVPVTNNYHGTSYCVVVDGVRKVTPLVLVFIMVAVMDIVFAVDSIPAILAVTTDPFVVYTSNIFAILGLRALYAVLAVMTELFRYLNVGLAVILILIGVKMLASDMFHFPVSVTLGAVAAILVLSVLASVVIPYGERSKG